MDKLIDKLAKGKPMEKIVRKINTAIKTSIPEAVEAFTGQLTEYKTSKSTIQLPYSKPLPLELIAEIAKWCEANN